MIQIAHVNAFNTATQLEETIYLTSGRHYFANNKVYLPFISQKLSYKEQLLGSGVIDGPATIGIGDLICTNIDGMLDYLTPYAFDGRKITVYLVTDENDTDILSKLPYFTGTIKHVEFNFDKMTINVRSNMEVLNVPMTIAVYLGTNVGAGAAGGYEGTTATIGGKTKPQIFGRCMSAEGAAVNDFFLVYAFNYDNAGVFKPLYAVYNVYVKGIAYYPSGDYAVPSLLTQATIATGFYATCLASGLIRLGSVPANNGAVVADVADAPEAQCSAAQVTQRILQANLSYVAGVNYDAGGLTYLDRLNACPVGYQVTSNETVGSVVTKILSSIGAWILPDANGLFRFGLIDKVAIMETDSAFYPVLSIGTSLYGNSISRVPTGDQSQNVPAKSVKLNHTKCWKTQAAGALADAVTQTLRTFFATDFRQATAIDLATAAIHPLAPALTYDSYANLPLAVPVVNGDFSVNIAGQLAGWVFGNNANGNGALTQAFGALTLTPSGGTCYVTQTLLGPTAISPGQWQLALVVPSTYGVNVTISQGVTVLVNTNYNAAVNDQDLIIPFTMSSGGTQSITITLTTLDSVNRAQIVSVAVAQPIAPLSPILAGLVNGNFNTALPAGWTASGGGTAVSSNSVMTLTPSGIQGQIVQTIVTPQIWAGNWVFSLTLVGATSLTITVKRGISLLYTSSFTSTVTQKIYVPFVLTAIGAQNITITLSTIDAVTPAVFSYAVMMLNSTFSAYAKVLNSGFWQLLSVVGNGWAFNTNGGSGTYAQTATYSLLMAAVGVNPSIVQTIAIPAGIGIGSWIFTLALNSGNCGILIQQGTVVLVNTTSNLALTTIPFDISTFGASTLTITLSTVSLGSVDIKKVQIQQGLSGSKFIYANLINGDFNVALAGTNWTYANDAGGTGTYYLIGHRITMAPVTSDAQISQSLIIGTGINAGNWNLGFVLALRTSIQAQVLQNGVILKTQNYTAGTQDVPINLPVVIGSVGNVTVQFRTIGQNRATIGAIVLSAFDTTSVPIFADLLNGAFDIPIINAAGGWAFVNNIGGKGTFSQLAGVVTLTPNSGTCQLQQNIVMPAGNWTLNLTVAANTVAVLKVVQNAVTLATVTSVSQATDLNITLAFTTASALPVTISIITVNSVTQCGVSNVVVQQAQIGLLPQQEAQRRLNILKQQMQRYTMDLPIRYTQSVMTGNVVTLVSPRFGLSAGKDFLVEGKSDDHDNEKVTLDVWSDGV